MKKRKIYYLTFLILVLVLLFSCATQQDLSQQQLELKSLQARMNRLEREVNKLKQESKSKVSEATILAEIDNLKTEIKMLSNSVDEYKDLITRQNREWEDFRSNIEQRISNLEAKKVPQPVTAPPTVHKPTPPVSSVPTTIPPTKPLAPDKKLYNEGFAAFKKGNYKLAKGKFREIIKKYPTSSLADNAQFWLAECYYREKDYENAILEYEKVIKNYPEGDKVPDALFKQGMAFLALGDKIDAKLLFNKVIKKYPSSLQAEIAKKKLLSIK